jgi:hypothetical protein
MRSLAFQNRKTWTKDLLGAINVCCRHRTVGDNLVALDDSLEVLGTGMPDLSCLEVLSNIGLLDLAFAESFGFLLDGRHHCELTIMSIMVVESVGVRKEVHINAVRHVDDQCTFALAVVGDVKLLANVLQREERMLVMVLESYQTALWFATWAFMLVVKVPPLPWRVTDPSSEYGRQAWGYKKGQPLTDCQGESCHRA